MQEEKVRMAGRIMMAAASSSTHHLQALNWAGSIPVVLTLAADSLSSPIVPPSIHVLLSRHTFLHTGLQDAVLRLHPFAPTAITFRRTAGTASSERQSLGVARATEPDPGTGWDDDDDDDDDDDGEDDDQEFGKTGARTGSMVAAASDYYPVCWFEDEGTQLPLQWHLFVGVIFDSLPPSTAIPSTHQTHPAPATTTEPGTTTPRLPWKIRLHFASYPHQRLLSLEEGKVLTTVQAYFTNSLKQALSLYLGGGGGSVMNYLTKEIHQIWWESIRTGNYSPYQQAMSLATGGGRAVRGGGGTSSGSHTTTDGSSGLPASNLASNLPFVSPASKPNNNNTLLLPIRLLVNTNPAFIQRPCRIESSVMENNGLNQHDGLTLGQLLSQWVPQYFVPANSDALTATTTAANPNTVTNSISVEKTPPHSSPSLLTTRTTRTQPGVTWKVAGIQPSLEALVWELWKHLCHPDHFLYIVVQTQ